MTFSSDSIEADTHSEGVPGRVAAEGCSGPRRYSIDRTPVPGRSGNATVPPA